MSDKGKGKNVQEDTAGTPLPPKKKFMHEHYGSTEKAGAASDTPERQKRQRQPVTFLKAGGAASAGVREEAAFRGINAELVKNLTRDSVAREEAKNQRFADSLNRGAEAGQAMDAVLLDATPDAEDRSVNSSAQHDAQASEEASVFPRDSDDDEEGDQHDPNTETYTWEDFRPNDEFFQRLQRSSTWLRFNRNAHMLQRYPQNVILVKWTQNQNVEGGTGTLQIKIQYSNDVSGDTVKSTQNKTTGEKYGHTQDKWREALMNLMCLIVLNGWRNVMGTPDRSARMPLVHFQKEHPLFYCCLEADLPETWIGIQYSLEQDLFRQRCEAMVRLCELAGVREVAREKDRVTSRHEVQFREAQGHENAIAGVSDERALARLQKQQFENYQMATHRDALMLYAMHVLIEWNMMPPLKSHAPEVVIRDKKHVDSRGDFAWTVFLAGVGACVVEYPDYEDETLIKNLFSFWADFFDHVGALFDGYFEASEHPSKVERCLEACDRTKDAVVGEIRYNKYFHGVCFGQRWDDLQLPSF